MNKTFIFILLAIVLLEGAFLAYINREEKGVYIEIEEIQAQQLSSFQELSSYFQDVAIKKGAGYAYDVLRTVSLPPNIDMHLMGHVVGDVLYDQQGLAGMSICTHDFRNACSHTIVVGLFFEKGEEALGEIAEGCRNAPGGKGAYTMCFHGLGHGVLAYAGYDLKKTVKLCKETGTQEYGNQEYFQCVGGAIMEMIGGGFHDRELWQEQREKYLKEADALFPCSSDFITGGARKFCYIYLTPYLWEFVGARYGFPQAEDFEKSFVLCDNLPFNDDSSRNACYGGFGKEFVSLVLGRDIRSQALATITDEQLNQIYEWCQLAGNQEGSAACISHAMWSLYWGGENDRSIAIRYCNVMTNSYYQRSCFVGLIKSVSLYIEDSGYRKEFCEEVPVAYQQECNATVKAK